MTINQPSPMHDNDAELVRLAQTGDTTKYSILAERYTGRIYNLIVRMCGNEHDAADLTQDALLRAWQNLPTFDGRAAFSTWLYRIAVNTVYSWQRKQKVRKTVPLDATTDDGHPLVNDIASHAVAVSDQMTNKDQVTQLLMAIDRLDLDHKTVIVLRDMEGLDYVHIADMLDINVGTLKSRLHRARMQLRHDIMNAKKGST